ncbi:MAG: NlpC/P60 family protein [Synergistaceae bacterium]
MNIDNYIGIPWESGGRRIKGCDCVGLVALVARDIFGYETENIEETCEWWNSEKDINLIKDVATLVDKPQPGDVLVFTCMSNIHTGIFIEPNRVLLMFRGGTSRGVRYSDGLRKRTISIYRGVRKCHQQ